MVERYLDRFCFKQEMINPGCEAGIYSACIKIFCARFYLVSEVLIA